MLFSETSFWLRTYYLRVKHLLRSPGPHALLRVPAGFLIPVWGIFLRVYLFKGEFGISLHWHDVTSPFIIPEILLHEQRDYMAPLVQLVLMKNMASAASLPPPDYSTTSPIALLPHKR